MVSVSQDVHEDDRCVTFDTCGRNPDFVIGNKKMFCENNDEPVEMTNANQTLLADYCSKYLPNDASNPTLCCNENQLKSMEGLFSNIAQNFGRCPVCESNLLNLFCSITCDPSQSLYVSVASNFTDDSNGVNELDVFLDRDYANLIFSSCRNVKSLQNESIPVISDLCNIDAIPGQEIDLECNANRFLNILGNPRKGSSPIKFNFYQLLSEYEYDHRKMEPGMTTYVNEAQSCSSSINDIPACECVDCTEVCQSNYTYDEIIHSPNRCSTYELCGPNPDTSGRTKMFCLYNEEPLEMSSVEGRTRLNQYCPEYDSTNPSIGPVVCCDNGQLAEMEAIFRTVNQFFARCPACLNNLLELFCAILCNPNQSLFVNGTSTAPGTNGKLGVWQMDFFVDKNFVYKMYDSCKDVMFPAANTVVMDLMCGGYIGTDCTPERWLAFFGSTTNGFVPFDITFFMLDEGEDHPSLQAGMKPFITEPDNCAFPKSNETHSCSCTDCAEACPPLPTIPPAEEPFEIAELDGYTFIMLMVFIGVFCVMVALFVVIALCNKQQKSSFNMTEKGHLTHKEADFRKPVTFEEISFLDKAAYKMDITLENFFRWWGTFVAKNPCLVLVIAVLLAIVAACGLFMIVIITDPVELWSAPGSRARNEKEYFDETFTPFYRTNQIIMLAPYGKSHDYETYIEGVQTFGPMVNFDILNEVLDLQTHLMTMEVLLDDKETVITLQDVCNQPLAPDLPDCLVQSVLQWWQNDVDNLHLAVTDPEGNTADWHDHFIYCMKSPLGLEDPTPLRLPCYSAFGGPSFAYVCTGGYEDDKFNEANALAVTLLNNNYRSNVTFFERAIAWEKQYLDYVTNYESKNNLTLFYYAERSVEDEILRSSQADILTIAISYIVIFAYIALALGDFTEKDRLMVDSKITLGLGGVSIVLLSVFASLGFYGYFGVSSTLIIIEVVPFLILAVGADNMFIFTLDYQRSKRRDAETRQEQIGRVLGEVGPSMLMCGVSEGISFFLGALTQMPAVKTFALYAGLAVMFNFLLQVTAFVALLALDTQRQEAGRYDILCCPSGRGKGPIPQKLGVVQWFAKTYYAPFIMNDYVRPVILIIFAFLTCMFGAYAFKVNIGLDQNLAMPRDSYCIDYFKALATYMYVGPPVYFVVTEGFDYTQHENQNFVCGGAGCNDDSLTQQIYYASKIKEYTYIAQPASSWIDDYFDWLQPGFPASTCCREVLLGDQAGDFCPATPGEVKANCKTCLRQNQRGERPEPDQFTTYLPFFLKDVPNEICNKGGSAAYGGAVKFEDPEQKKGIKATYYMTYHTPLVVSDDYITSLKQARLLADQIQARMRNASGVSDDFTVWPYSLVYVYYEQYLNMAQEGAINLAIAMVPIFLASVLMLGFDVLSALIIVFTILMIVINLLGVMYLWTIEYNALSLVNIIMAVGMSVEFVSHTTRTFKHCTLPTRKQRAEYALFQMGSSVFSGVAMTNLPGIIVLAFAKSQVFEVFYFRMFLTITLSALWHGIVFLPVVLSYIGTDVNKAKLFAEQLERAAEEKLSIDKSAKSPEPKQDDENDGVILKPPAIDDHSYDHLIVTSDEKNPDEEDAKTEMDEEMSKL